MPLRPDPTAWWNVSGIVAAYQPVRAPGPMLARYNQAHGGDNRYKAMDGVAPTWASTAGWLFDYTSKYLDTGIVPASLNWTMIARVYSYTHGASQYNCICGSYTSVTQRFQLWAHGNDPSLAGYTQKGSVLVAPRLAESGGILGANGANVYRNGISEGTMSGTYTLPTASILLGRSQQGLTTYGLNGYLAAVAIYSVSLAPAQMFSVSRQMQYCDVNPDWSVWGRRRQWYYAPQAAGTVRILPNARGVVGLGDGGVSIQPQGTVNL